MPLKFQIGIHLDSYNESLFRESLTNPDRNLIVSWDPTPTFLHGIPSVGRGNDTADGMPFSRTIFGYFFYLLINFVLLRVAN